MRLTLLQQDILWGEPSVNLHTAQEAIYAASRSDLYVLPEMFSTGFATQPEDVAERDGRTLEWMQGMADDTGGAVGGSVATEDGGLFYNRFYFVKPRGVACCYDKRHLFTYGGEHLCYTAGNKRVIVEWEGLRFLLLVCYDLRFPVWSRSHEDYDAIIYVASWPKSRREVWNVLLRARAIENQCYVFGVNRVGFDPVCDYDGGTMAIDAYGRIIAQCPDNEQSFITVDIDITSLETFRGKFPVLKDRDTISV